MRHRIAPPRQGDDYDPAPVGAFACYSGLLAIASITVLIVAPAIGF